jgi:hypothetical protein
LGREAEIASVVAASSFSSGTGEAAASGGDSLQRGADMIRKTMTCLALLLLATISGWGDGLSTASAGLVTYNAEGSGGADGSFSDTGFFQFNGTALVSLSYEYDSSIPGITTGGTTTFDVPTLYMSVSFPDNLGGIVAMTSEGNGTITWNGKSLDFFTSDSGVESPPRWLDLSFPSAGNLTPGQLPQSLDALGGSPGVFLGYVQAYPEGEFSVAGYVSPEPSSILILGLGITGAAGAWVLRRRSRSPFTRPASAP